MSQSMQKMDFKVHLRATPFKLTPLLWKVMDNQISLLINNPNMDIGISLVNNLRTSGRENPSEFIFNYGCYSTGLTKSHAASVIRRGALGSFNLRFNQLCLSTLASASNKEVIRQNACPPIGFGYGVGSAAYVYPCKGIFCTNCYMRKANQIRKELASRLELKGTPPESAKALIVRSCNVGQINSYGYDFNLDDDLSERITYRLKKINFIAIRTIGATMGQGRVPIACTTTAIILDAENIETATKSLTKLKASVFKKNPNRTIEVTSEQGLDNICLRLYDSPPVCLAGISSDGIHNSMLQHSLESYKSIVKGKKKAIIFGTGVI